MDLARDVIPGSERGELAIEVRDRLNVRLRMRLLCLLANRRGLLSYSGTAHLLAVLTGNDAIAVELDLVQRTRSRRRPVGERRRQGAG